MRRGSVFALLLSSIALLSAARPARAFCGFYVAKADAKLFNRSSQVALVRDGNRTVLTMGSDFEGDPREFAIVIPVPTSIEKSQIHIGDLKLLEHLDAYSAPRLVEYHDPDPCGTRDELQRNMKASAAPAAAQEMKREGSLGVRIEARYTVGEYDVLILSARDSSGLETWLRENQYRIPSGASSVLQSYIRQGMRFFLAKVNLAEKERLGFSTLRPIQVAYESPKFMLPIRLGMVNAKGPQELFIYAMTRGGRVEATNYRTLPLPSGVEIPLYVKERFGDFYKALFNASVRRESMEAVFTEYAWDMGSCDPCAAEPLRPEELRGLGVFWLGANSGGSPQVFLTRLHVRYDAAHFPEDLAFQETSDRQSFQARYILRHPYAQTLTCEANEYRESLAARRETEVKNLVGLTGWKPEDVRRRMGIALGPGDTRRWFERIWN